MKNFLRILGFELRTRWFLLLMPVVYFFCFLPLYNGQRAQSSLSFGPNLFLLLQLPLIVGSIFQNRPWGGKDQRLGGLEFPFTRAISRAQLFWAKALIYLFASVAFGLSALVLSAFHPEISLRQTYRAEARQATNSFYLENFSEAALKPDPEDKTGRNANIHLPRGRVAVGWTMLVIGIAFALCYQVVVFFLPETRLATVLLLITLFIGVVLVPLLSLWWWRIESLMITPYDRLVAMVGRHPLVIFLGLGALALAVESFCCRRFVRKEVL